MLYRKLDSYLTPSNLDSSVNIAAQWWKCIKWLHKKEYNLAKHGKGTNAYWRYMFIGTAWRSVNYISYIVKLYIYTTQSSENFWFNFSNTLPLAICRYTSKSLRTVLGLRQLAGHSMHLWNKIKYVNTAVPFNMCNIRIRQSRQSRIRKKLSIIWS